MDYKHVVCSQVLNRSRREVWIPPSPVLLGYQPDRYCADMPAKNARDERDAEDEDRTAFGAALAEALKARGLTQVKFGAMIGRPQGSISAYVNGQDLPDTRRAIFDMERVLELPPGHLSRHLGYLPPSAAGAEIADVGRAIDLDPMLEEDSKQALKKVYEGLVRAPGVPTGRPKKGSTRS